MAKTLRVKGRKDLTDRLIAKLNRIRPRKDGDGSFEVSRTTDAIMSNVKYVISTGIRSFDAVTGCLPFGRITEIYGLDASGKTAMVMRACVRAQQRHIYKKIRSEDGTETKHERIPLDSDVTILYVDNEQSLNDDEKIVIDGTQIDGILERCDTVDLLFKSIEAVVDDVLEYQKETGREQFLVVIVDTIAGTASKEELKQEWGKDDYNRQPKQLRQGFRKMARKISRANVCMICTNQVSDRYDAAVYSGGRAKSTTPQDGDFSTFGGRALKYYASLRIFMYRMRTKYVLSRGVKFDAGFLIGFKTTKNRMSKPMREGRIALLFSDGLNDTFSLLETLIFLEFAAWSDDGSISFKFKKNGIETKTFGDKKVSLQTADDDEDEEESSRHNPKIMARVEWPSFYAQHQEDVDALWARAVEYIFAIEGMGPVPDEAILEEDEDILEET